MNNTIGAVVCSALVCPSHAPGTHYMRTQATKRHDEGEARHAQALHWWGSHAPNLTSIPTSARLFHVAHAKCSLRSVNKFPCAPICPCIWSWNACPIC